jgi:glutaminase
MDEETKKKLGIHRKDVRFSEHPESENSFTSKYKTGTLKIHDWSNFTEKIKCIFEEIKLDNSGSGVADYIPQLANVDDSLFSLCVVSVDGQVLELGDSNHAFSIQSCSKPITYAVALDNYGEEFVHNFVGKEPSGRNFNNMCLDEDNLPHNPLINAGAIMTTSLINKSSAQAERFDYAMNYWKDLTPNTHMGFNNSIYLSEKDTADRNYCLAYMMQEQKSFQNGKNEIYAKENNRTWEKEDLVKNLELYFQFCSMETKILGAGMIAATLANGGIQPWTNKKIFKYSTVKSTLSIMLTCGMYDYSGEWGYSIGIPAKSGVSGLIYAVIPGVCGIAIYSPKLDKIGNSYRGIKFFKKFVETFNIHIFDNDCDKNKISIIQKEYFNKNLLGFFLLNACKTGDLTTIQEVISKGCDINYADYDDRTALHIACSEENIKVIEFLINKDIRIKKDRWGNTPYDDTSETIKKILLEKYNLDDLHSK